MFELVADILREVRLSGFLDIAFISIFIYVILVLFKHSKARFIITGIIIISIVYLISRQLNLVLTSSLLQAFYAVILLALIIIFQEEIRRFFEQVALWSLNPKLRSSKSLVTNEKEIRILADTLSDLAKHKIGALIVIKGKTPIGGYLDGGESLDGKLSESLLKSIFDPHSIGHDGAVIIDNDKITMFAAHLPLSKNFSQLKNRGTRHAAALGLAEVTDALCLVVSEEKGTVSVARNGKLEQIGLEQLNLTLEKFYNEVNPSIRKITRIDISSNYKEKIIALLLAIILWFAFVHESRLVYKSFKVPVDLKIMNPGLEVEDVDPYKVEVTFLGPRREFYFFSLNEVKLSLKIPNAQSGVEYINISESDINVARDISTENIEPRRVMVQIEKIQKENGVE